MTFSRRRRQADATPAAELRAITYPCPYPNGWYAVAFSDELPPGTVTTRRFMGSDIVLYRTRAGVLRAIRPFCPHLGAHLGYGGRIDGENLVCPFHHFAFDPSGTCVATGYGTPPPKQAALTSVEVRETDTIVLVWYHARELPPDWEVPSAPAAGNPHLVHRVRTLVDYPQDVIENLADIGHLEPVHHVKADYHELDFDGHIFSALVHAKPLGSRLGLIATTNNEVTVRVYGLGFFIAEAHLSSLGIRFHLWLLPTPIDPVHVQFRVALRLEHLAGLSLPHWAQRLLGRILLRAFLWDIGRDFPIWAHRTYQKRPRLAAGDGPIMAFRRWAQQFYSDPVDDSATAPMQPDASIHGAG